jgi:hypothetical protein
MVRLFVSSSGRLAAEPRAGQVPTRYGGRAGASKVEEDPWRQT